MSVTQHQLDVGYALVEKMADDQGYGWTFGLISKSAVQGGLKAVFTAMAGAAPAPVDTPAPQSQTPIVSPPSVG